MTYWTNMQKKMAPYKFYFLFVAMVVLSTAGLSCFDDRPPARLSAVSNESRVVAVLEQRQLFSLEEVRLISAVTMAEAEGEPEAGKRLVIDTILNRAASPYFPSTVHDVIYQPNQFEAMWNGRFERCEANEDIFKLVLEELGSRTNSDVIFFMAGEYSYYGTPMFQIGNHYFSSY